MAWMHMAAATVNQTVGDWTGNTARILSAIEQARGRGASLLVMPEMCISGYSLGDRLQRPGTLERSWRCLEEIAAASTEIATCVGLPVLFDGVIYNVMAVVCDGKIHGMVAKENLATGDVEYESRWYQPWSRGRTTTYRTADGRQIPFGNLAFDLGGAATMAMEICEDGWLGLRPGSRYALAGAEILANPSASWFTVGKHAVRRRMVEQISQEDHCAYLYTSLLGCDATRLVFDGSAFITQDGDMLREAPRFVFDKDVVVIDAVVDVHVLRQRRMEVGSWRDQVRDVMRGDYGPLPTTVRVPGDFFAARPAPEPVHAYWEPRPPRPVDASLKHFEEAGFLKEPLQALELPHFELELALCMGLRDYLRKTGAPGYCLALSGGRDSAMVAYLVRRMYAYDRPDLQGEALDAYVKERFVCAYMGTRNSSQTTLDAAAAVAKDCGAEHLCGDIDDFVQSATGAGVQMLGRPLDWSDAVDDLALQNVQARARSVLIWLIANVRRFILLSTSNKSESAVGYATMDGDTSGGLSPIADVPKSLVQTWLLWAGRRYGYQGIAEVFGAPASAELRPPESAQTDEDDLMPFVVLDQLMYHFVQMAMDPAQILLTLWPTFKELYQGDPKPFADHIARFVKMLCQAQWKRERFAISFRVMPFDLDPKGGFRFPPVQSGFREELDELYQALKELQAEA